MAGIYFHIPFCKKKCIYCDFFSGNFSREVKDRYLLAMMRELEVRRKELKGEEIATVYFGGGTPSLLFPDEIGVLLHSADCCKGAEVTVEVNPDDVTAEYIANLRKVGVNRISMGVQSFNDKELKLLGRRHNARKAIDAAKAIRYAGISNLSIDLIYGIPGQSEQSWRKSLEQAIALHPKHISAYSLTYEEGTTLSRLRDEGAIAEVNDDLSVRFFDMLLDTLEANGYKQYEISNFSLPGKQSRHNSAYWQFTPYLGIGASAHSFDGKVRRYNPSNLSLYINKVLEQGVAYEEEHETLSQLYDEWVMTRLRTAKGMNLKALGERFGESYLAHCRKAMQPHLQQGLITITRGVVRLTRKGVMLSDMVFRDLFYDEE